MELINQLKTQRVFFLLTLIATLTLTANVVAAQQDTTPKKRLRSPATVNGFIGGESHDSYVIRGRKDRRMTVQISWRIAGDNRAEFTVSGMPDFFNSEPVSFGNQSNEGKRWSGRIPRTGDYYIYVVAHPTAHYKLSVK